MMENLTSEEEKQIKAEFAELSLQMSAKACEIAMKYNISGNAILLDLLNCFNNLKIEKLK